MKVFKVSAESFGYDEYDSCIVVAESKDAVRKMIKEEVRLGRVTRLLRGDRTSCMFDSGQGKIVIEEVDLTKQDVILASYNAG